MEFYNNRNKAHNRKAGVSIPNGMEFYLVPKNKEKVTARFNSQRDGILRVKLYNDHFQNLFQFPTGWNSTLGNFLEILLEIGFQFPTGWNSTMQREKINKAT